MHPKRALYEICKANISINARQVMYQAQVNSGKTVEVLRRLQVHFGKREDARALPGSNLMFDSWRRKQIGFLGTPWSFLSRRRTVHVIASAVMFCAILTNNVSVQDSHSGTVEPICTIVESSRRSECAAACKPHSQFLTWCEIFE